MNNVLLRPTNHIHRDGEVFVFGSNLRGVHGAGAALDALNKYGAVLGEGIGRVGMSYAIPTKDYFIRTMTLHSIRPHVAVFLDYAACHPDERFFVTAIGTGLAGHSLDDMANMFTNYPDNCRIPPEWKRVLDAADYRW